MQLNYIEIEQFDVTYKSSSLIPNTIGFFFQFFWKVCREVTVNDFRLVSKLGSHADTSCSFLTVSSLFTNKKILVPLQSPGRVIDDLKIHNSSYRSHAVPPCVQILVLRKTNERNISKFDKAQIILTDWTVQMQMKAYIKEADQQVCRVQVLSGDC
jgi:hypothetical protein